jgi:Ca2+-binding RTX toxin-like protein
VALDVGTDTITPIETMARQRMALNVLFTISSCRIFPARYWCTRFVSVICCGAVVAVLSSWIWTLEGVASSSESLTSPITLLGPEVLYGYEPSGLFWSSQNEMFYMVSDNGKFIAFTSDGNIDVTDSVVGDLEAVTMSDENSNKIYIGVERNYAGQRDNAIIEYDLQNGLTGKRWSLNNWMNNTNNNLGLEALTFVPNIHSAFGVSSSGGYFYAGLQQTGDIYVFDINTSHEEDVTYIAKLSTGISDISGMHFSLNSGTLYAIFDTHNVLIAMNSDGNEKQQLILPGSNQEGLAVRDNCGGGAEVVVAEDHASDPAVRKYGYTPDVCGDEEMEDAAGDDESESASPPGLAEGLVVAQGAGDGVASVSWSAPASDGGAAITDYVVEYSADGGSSWFVFADGTSTSTSATVTGLLNGMGYVFRVSAVNSAGAGSVSVVSAMVAPWWPAPAGCTIVGTPGDDVLYGTSGADHICGLGGNDKIYGKAGNDILDGGPGKDKLFGGKGKDRLYGRGGADVLKGGPGNDKLYGNGGRDRLYGQAGNDRLVGGSNRDKLYGQGGRDKLYGGKARDLLVGGAKKDVLNGGKGKDKAKKPGPDVLVSIEVVVP